MTKENEIPKIQSNTDVAKAILIIKEFMMHGKKPVLVAIDGRSGTGKSTIAKYIASQLGGREIVSDDFWVGGEKEEWDEREPKDRASLAIDWKRLRLEVLEPLLAGRRATWHPFDWKAGKGLVEYYITCDPTPLIVLDGAYSTCPELLDIVDLTILVEMSDDSKRRARLVNREKKEYMDDWHSRWDPAEDYYYKNIRPRSSFDIIIENN